MLDDRLFNTIFTGYLPIFKMSFEMLFLLSTALLCFLPSSLSFFSFCLQPGYRQFYLYLTFPGILN